MKEEMVGRKNVLLVLMETSSKSSNIYRLNANQVVIFKTIDQSDIRLFERRCIHATHFYKGISTICNNIYAFAIKKTHSDQAIISFDSIFYWQCNQILNKYTCCFASSHFHCFVLFCLFSNIFFRFV